MTDKNDGGPAFPVPGLQHDEDFNGMPLRKYFAAKAMQGWFANSESTMALRADKPFKEFQQEMCGIFYDWADAMLAAAHPAHPARGVVDGDTFEAISAEMREVVNGYDFDRDHDLSEWAKRIDVLAAQPAVPEFNQRAFGLACTVAWTELVNALRADGHTVGDKSGPATREWIVGIVRDTFAATPAHDQPEGEG